MLSPRSVSRQTDGVKAWLARRPHWHVHFTPTSASWLNQVERWFAELTRKQLKRGVHRSTRQLEADIRAFIETHNENPRPFKWTNGHGRRVGPPRSMKVGASRVRGRSLPLSG